MDKKRDKKLPTPRKPELVEPIIANGMMHFPGQSEIISDPDGSYTGRPIGGGEPVQDADDL